MRVTHIFAILLFVASLTFGFGGCGESMKKIEEKDKRASPLRTPEALMAAATAALKAGNGVELAKLFPSLDQIKKACPDVTQEELESIKANLEEVPEKISSNLAACKAMLDWSKSELVETKLGKEEDKPTQGCKGAHHLSETSLTFKASGQKVVVFLHPMRIGKEYYLMDRFVCRSLQMVQERQHNAKTLERERLRRHVTTKIQEFKERERQLREQLETAKSKEMQRQLQKQLDEAKRR